LLESLNTPIDLFVFLEHLRASKIDIFLFQQGFDTSTPAGRMMYGMLSVFSAFEREMIVERVRSGPRPKRRAPSPASPSAVPRYRSNSKPRSVLHMQQTVAAFGPWASSSA
jgi:DNA invertase Pin-like site-specific DNA recombinase